MRLRNQFRNLGRFPFTKEPFDLGLERLPLDVAGNREDRPVRAEEAGVLLAHRLGG